MARQPRFATACVVICDSMGCGNAPDAAAFGDEGANTLGHVIQACRPSLPNLAGLGLDRIPGVPSLGSSPGPPRAAWGRMVERAPAKDTMAGHWELMGVVADRAFPTYPAGFPDEIIREFSFRTGREVLGNRAASGTDIIEQLGAEHVRTGAPIVYTSGDSVFQIAAHEEVIAVDELYAMCAVARAMLTGRHGVGRVIARPFTGDAGGGFHRTGGRRDYPFPPPALTALDHLAAAGIPTHAVGKIHDIFAGRGIASYVKTADNADGLREITAALRTGRRGVIFANLVDFDSEYGHRNDATGYAGALEELDRGLPGLLAALPTDGCLLLTADHGNDPTTPGTDHSRECVPLLVHGAGVTPNDLGTRETFADVGATLLENFGLDGPIAGRSFLGEL